MSSGSTSGNFVDRTSETFDRLAAAYRSAGESVQIVSPYVVRVIEVVLAIGLFAALAHWLYWVFVVGV